MYSIHFPPIHSMRGQSIRRSHTIPPPHLLLRSWSLCPISRTWLPSSFCYRAEWENSLSRSITASRRCVGKSWLKLDLRQGVRRPSWGKEGGREGASDDGPTVVLNKWLAWCIASPKPLPHGRPTTSNSYTTFIFMLFSDAWLSPGCLLSHHTQRNDPYQNIPIFNLIPNLISLA